MVHSRNLPRDYLLNVSIALLRVASAWFQAGFLPFPPFSVVYKFSTLCLEIGLCDVQLIASLAPRPRTKTHMFMHLKPQTKEHIAMCACAKVGILKNYTVVPLTKVKCVSSNNMCVCVCVSMCIYIMGGLMRLSHGHAHPKQGLPCLFEVPQALPVT